MGMLGVDGGGWSSATTAHIGEWYQAISQLGLPILFVYGLRMRWWVMRSETDLLQERLAELREQLALQREQLERATTLSEANNELIASLREQVARLAALREAEQRRQEHGES